MMQYVGEAELHAGWAKGRINDPVAGAAQVRRILPTLFDQGVRINAGLYSGLLADLAAEELGADRALVRIDEALGLTVHVENSCALPFLHRLRGDILLKGEQTDPAPAEDAYRAAIGLTRFSPGSGLPSGAPDDYKPPTKP